MDMMKRILALLLVFAMLMPNLTTIASAVDTGEEPDVFSTEPVVLAEEPEDTEATEAATEALTEPPAEETEAPAVVETEALAAGETEPPVAEETEPPVEETEPPVEETEVPVIEDVLVEETVTDPAASDENSTELVVEVVTVEESVVSDSDYSNDDMFAMYLDRVMYPEKPSTLGTAGFDSLDAKNQQLYLALAEMAADLAANGGSSVYEPTDAEWSEMGFGLTMSKQEIAGTSTITEITAEHKAKIAEILDMNLAAVVDALLADLPYDLYWYDKTVGTGSSYGIGYRNQQFYVTNLSVEMRVASAYQGGSNLAVSSSAAQAASAVVETAADVVLEHASKSDYEKLVAYKDYICGQVTYNRQAASSGYTGGYGDPWQVIYVFDDDSTTNVVCEGYSKAFQYLCDLSDFRGNVESYLIAGYAGGPHMWNIVSIGGNNYLVDVTNTDPAGNGMISFGEQNDLLFLAGTTGSIDEGYTFYNYQFSDPALTYLYSYEVTYTNGTKEIIQPAIDVYGTDADSVLILADSNYVPEAEDDEADLRDELANGAYLDREVTVTAPATFQDLTVGQNGKLIIQGTTVTLSGNSWISQGAVELTDGAELIVQGNLYLMGEYDSEEDRERLGLLRLNEGSRLTINGENRHNTEGRIYVWSFGSIEAEDNTVFVPDGTIAINYGEGRQTGLPQQAQFMSVQVTDAQILADAAEDLYTIQEDGTAAMNYNGAEIRINRDVTINGEITFHGGDVVLRMQNDGLEEDGVTMTIANGAVLSLKGCEMAIQEGTELIVEGTLNCCGSVNIWGGRLNCKETGAIKVLDNGQLANYGVVYMSGALITEEEGREPGYLSGDEIIFTESHISLRWLENHGNGWFENPDSELNRDIHMAPGEQYFMIAYLNQWNEGALDWDRTPIHANKLIADGDLIVEPFSMINDGSNHVEEGQNFDCFFRMRPADGVVNATSTLAYSNTGIQLQVRMARRYNGFYREDPTTAEEASDLWINDFCVGGESDSFYFYFDPDLYHDQGWALSNVTVADSTLATAVRTETPNLWKITITEETAENIYAMHDFHLQVNFTLTKDGEENRSEDATIRCYAADFGEPNASFGIGEERYHASWNYDGLFRFEQNDQGDWYPVPAEIQGVSYDIDTNTLTLDGAHLPGLHIDNHWRNEETGDEGWNLPNGQFTINLVGSNSISATNDHALYVGGDMHLIITGEGSLDIALNGDETNHCHSTVMVNDADLTVQGNAKVHVQVSGVGSHEDETGVAHPMNLMAISGNGENRGLQLRENAVVTTEIPAGACANGSFGADGSFGEGGGFNGIEFCIIEINDNATLNTQTIRVWDAGLGNAFGGYYQNGGTVNISGMPHYNKDFVSEETGAVGHYHFSGLEADYGKIDINGGVLNIDITATEAQKAKNTYYHAIQSRGRHIGLNGGEINITGNISGIGMKVGEDNWDGGTNAWVDFNGTILNMTGSSLYRTAVEVAPNGSVNFNGGQINAHRADIRIRGQMNWNGTNLNATESGLLIVEGGKAMVNGGYLNIRNGNFVVDNRYDENGSVVTTSVLEMRGGYVELNNSFAYLAGAMKMESGALIQSVDYRKLTAPGAFAQAMVIRQDGCLELCGDAYLQINGKDKVDGIYNEGILRQHGGNLVVDVDETTDNTAALFGPGANRFENGDVYLDGYNGLVQFNKDETSQLYVGGNAVMNANGKTAGIITYAPALFEGGNVHAHAACPVQTVTDAEGNTITLYPTAVTVENNEGGTNASLTITGGNHYFEVFDGDTLDEQGRGLVAVNAPVSFIGGALDIEAETAVYNVTEDGESSVNVPVIISNENGGVLTMTYSDALEAHTLLVGENYARSVAFRLSQNCGDNVRWNLTDGVLTISVIDATKPGGIDNYHMPINDPASWRVAPWYTMADTITKVVVEEGVEYIGDWAFGRLPEVTQIVYASTVNRIDMTSNYACPKLEKFVVADGNGTYSVSDEGKVLVENGSLVRAAVKGITSYRAGDDIRTIGMGAFDSSALEELDLNQVTTIQNYAFADCLNLKTVVIPEGVETIEMTVFQNSGLESITIPASVTKIRNYAFDGCTALANVYYTGSESQWNSIVIGSGNNALTSIPVTFLETSSEEKGDGLPYLSYHLLTFGDRGYYEDMAEVRTDMTVPVGFYTTMVVYCNIWNEAAQKWERSVVDPAQLYGQDLEIGLFRNYQGIGIEEGEPNADHFFEMAVTSGWGETRTLNYNVSEGVVASLTITLTRSNVGFYSADPTHMSTEQRNAAWLNFYPINPNVSGHSIYFALTEYNGDFNSVTVHSDRLTEADMAKVQVEEINGSVYRITLPDEVAAKVYEYRGIPIQVTYQYGDQEEQTVGFTFGSVSFNEACISFVIDGGWYEYYPGLEGYFSWDEENQKRLAHKELPAGMTYDYDSDVLTMNNSTIESLQIYWNWHDENTGNSGFATKDNDLTLELIGENKILNPNSNAALEVGDGLTLTITGDASSSLLISSTNANATEHNYSHNAVNIYNDADLIIAGDTTVTTSISSGGKQLQDAWLMNIWAGGNNSITIRDNATLNTTVPAGARDDGDGQVNGYRGIDWFGELRIQDNAKLNTTTLGLSDYYDEHNQYHGKGTYIQTGGTVTIEALGFTNDEGRHNYHGLFLNGGTEAIISGGKLIVKANGANAAADAPGAENTTYAWFSGIESNGWVDISGETTMVEIISPADGAGLCLNNSGATLRDGATLKFQGNGSDTYALDVSWNSNFQLNGGKVDITDAKVRVMEGAVLEIHNGELSVLADKYPHQTYLETWQNSAFYLHNGSVTVNNGSTADTPNAVSVGGHMELNGGTMTVSGTNALGVLNGGNLYQHGAELTVKGIVTTLTTDDNAAIYLNGGITNAILGEKLGADGGDIDMGGGSARSISADIINTWSAAVNVYPGGYLEVNGGNHTFRVDGTPGQDEYGNDIWLCALDVAGNVNFTGGKVHLDAGENGQAIWNRETGDITVGFHNGMGAVDPESGESLYMQSHGDGSAHLGKEEDDFASSAVIMSVSAGDNSSWHIVINESDEVLLFINGGQDMYNFYMPENDKANWAKTPWFDYNDRITHVFVEDGINHIGDWAFAYMPKLRYVQLPGSVNHISTSAFYGCAGLETFCMPGNDNYYLEESTRTGPDENGNYSGPVIIEGGWKVLKAATTLTEFEVPQYISEIGNGAFQNCTNLTELTFATDENSWSNVWNIGNNAFQNTGLTRIDLPSGIRSIGSSAFDGCGSATAITLPESVSAIRPYAFSGCGNVTTVTFEGSQEAWSKISIGTGNNVLDQVTFAQTSEGGEDYLSFRWLDHAENGWQENEHPAETEVHVPAGMHLYGVFYHNHWDEETGTWTATPVIPTGDSSLTIARIDEAMMEEMGWQIAPEAPNSEFFLRVIVAADAWDTDAVNHGIVTANGLTLDIQIHRDEGGFYSEATASNETWMNAYEMDPLKTSNVFYFIFEKSEDRIMIDSSFHIWNHNGVPDSYIKVYDVGEGIFRIVLDPIFLQDAWRYGGFQLWAGYDVMVAGNEYPEYREIGLQMIPKDLGNPDAILEINDTPYLYFAEQNGWMTYGDPANDWRPGVALLPAGVSYDYTGNTLTLNNAKLNNLSLRYRDMDENGNLTDHKLLRDANLTLNLMGSSVIETGHRSALEIGGGLNVTVQGSGSLLLHSHNDPETRDEYGNQYAFDTLVVAQNSTLNVAGGNVTAEISGEGYWHNGEPAMPAAIRGRDDSSLVISGGTLTTLVPENARDNSPGEVDFEHYYSTHAISEMRNITVSGGTLNTTSLYLNSGERYTQTGGTANITGLGHLTWQWDEYGNRFQNYHYNGIQVQQNATAEISGGQLNLTVTPRDWEHGSSSFYNALSLAGGTANISEDARIHVNGAYDGNAIALGYDQNENGQPCGNGTLNMTGGTLTMSNEVPGSHMNGVEVAVGCEANISGGTLNLVPENSFGGLRNEGELTIGGSAEVKLNWNVWSNGTLNVQDNAKVDVTHAEGTDMYAWDIVPGSKFNFVSGTITGKNAAFLIGGQMTIGEAAVLDLTDSDFHADGVVTLDGGSLTLAQNDLVDNKFLGIATDEWGNSWEEYEHQSRLYVTGELNLNSGSLTLQNAAMNMEGSAVVNQNGATVSITNETAATRDRESNNYESDNWMVSARMDVNTTLNVNGGSFTMDTTNFNNGLESNGTININNGTVHITMDNGDANSALRSNGDLNMRGGTLTVETEGFAALAAQGQVHISGGEVNLSGQVGYHHWYETGFEQGKLTVTGGNINIDALNTGLDLYNDMVMTGGNIDIAVSGYTQSFTDEKGVPMKLLAGCGIMGYNDYKKISISINGGTLNIDAPVEVASGCNAVSVFGILGGRNTTVRINGGDVGIRARNALYAESQETGKHVVINSRMQVLSMNTGNVLDISSGIVSFDREGQSYTWYVDTFEEDETWTTPYDNRLMADYATDLRIVERRAGTNALWDLQDGTLTISAPGGTVGTMVQTADWNLVADKITKVVIEPAITSVDTSALDLMTNLKDIKAPHNSAAETYAREKGITLEYFHQPQGDKPCVVEGCALATFSSIVESDKDITEKVEKVQEIDNEDLKKELENSETSAEQFKELEESVETDVTVAVESKDDQDIPEELDITGATVVGAKMNAEEDTAKVALVIGAPETPKEVDTSRYEKVISFSMELTTTNTQNEEQPVENLKTPVQITLPLPSDMDVERLEILHYHDDGTVESVKFTHVTLEGKTFVSFWVTGFSDFDIRLTAQKLKVVVDQLAITYGEAVPSLVNAYKVLDDKGNAAVLPEGVTVTVNAPTVTKAGTYPITATVNKNGVECDITVDPGELTVAKQQYTIAVQDQTMVYGGEQPDLTNGYQILDKNGNAADLPVGVTVTVRMPNVTKAGEYALTAQVAVYENYAFTVKDGKLTVSKQPVTVTMDAKSIKIGEALPELTYTVTKNGKVLTAEEIAACGLDITAKVEGFNNQSAGTYVINAFVEEHELYEVTVATAELTVKAEEVIPEFTTSMIAYLTLENEVYLNVAFNFTDTAELNEAEIQKRASRMGLLIWDNSTPDEANAVVGTSDRTITNVVYKNSRFEVRTAGIPAKRLGDTMSVRAYYQCEDGSYIYGRYVKNYSPKKYCYSGLKDTNAKDDALMIAILNYGAAAQIFFDHDVNNLMNSDLTADQQALKWADTLVRSDWSISAEKEGGLTRNKNIITGRGGYLSLEGAIDYNYYIKVSSSVTVAKAEMLVWSENAYNAATALREDNASFVTDMEYITSKGRYEFKYDGLAAKDMFSPVYTCAKITDDQGNVFYGGVLAYCPERYTYVSITTSSDAEEIELAKRVAIYGDAARTYFYG